MRILITGGCGFIGSALCLRLVAEGHEVANLDALTYAAHPQSLAGIEDAPNYRLVRGDIRDRERIFRLFDEWQPDAVMHLAAESHVDRSIDAPLDFVTTNVIGTCNLLEAATSFWERLPQRQAAAFRFLHVSTDEVYGDLNTPDARPFSESHPYAPSSPYAASKAAADHFVRAWHRTYGLPVLITNCSNNYGPRQFPEKLIPLMILSALHDMPLPVYGKGDQIRDWIHVDDHVSALLAVLEKGRPGRTYNIGARCERRNIEVVRSICDILDRLAPRSDGRSHAERITFVTDRPGHDRRYAIDPGRIERETGWRPRIPFEKGLERTVQWYLDNEDWWRPLWNRNRGRRLGLAGRTSDDSAT